MSIRMHVASWNGFTDCKVFYIFQAAYVESILPEVNANVVCVPILKDLASLTKGRLCSIFLFEDGPTLLSAADNDEELHNHGDLPLTSPPFEDEDELVCTRCGAEAGTTSC